MWYIIQIEIKSEWIRATYLELSIFTRYNDACAGNTSNICQQYLLVVIVDKIQITTQSSFAIEISDVTSIFPLHDICDDR